jgi:predicted Holliday junction resolvase-like endonuclease
VTLTLIILLPIIISFIFYKELKKNKELREAYETQLNAYKKLVPELGSVIPISHFREVVDKKDSDLAKFQIQLYETEQKLSELKSQQQSKSVRLGLISENVIPFHQDFKYNVKDLVPMFKPIDYIVFAENEIVFLEIKMGTSQLSEKQKNIRKLVEEGRIRFEEHRISETGYTVKETDGKEKKAQLRS